MTASDWISIAGTIVSVAGLIFSWMAWKEAGRAKKAAEDASRVVRLRETADEFVRLAVEAKELLNAVQTRERDKAVDLATNLAHRLMVAGQHRASYLPEGFSAALCVENLQKISVRLASEGFPEDTRKIAKLLRSSQQIHESLCGTAGAVQGRTEGAEG